MTFRSETEGVAAAIARSLFHADHYAKLGPDEHLELSLWNVPGHVLRLAYWRGDLSGLRSPGAGTYREHEVEVDIDPRLLSRHKAIVIQIVDQALHYLAACIVPWRKPRGYRMLRRHAVVTTPTRRVWKRWH